MIRSRFSSFFDERFFRHRYQATSHAAMVAATLLGGLCCYDLVVNDRLRWDLAVVLAAMALTKIVAMVYYRFRD